MRKPEALPGMVVRYDYLWQDDHNRGRREGNKERPCAIVVTRRVAGDGEVIVMLAAITHTPPINADTAIEVPQGIKRLLGLDANRSWIAVTEINVTKWSDPGIVPVSASQWSYGFLPPRFTQKIVDAILDGFRTGRIAVMRRS